MLRRSLQGLIPVALCALLGQDARASELVIRGGTLIDPELGVVEHAVLVIEDQRLRCVGRASSCPLPEGAVDVDARGRWIVPGLIDTHVHVSPDSPQSPDFYQTLRLAYGITLTREASSYPHLESNLERRAASEDPELPVPRLLVAGGLHAKNLRRYAMESPRALARHLIELGVDSLKLKQGLAPSDLADVVAVAREAGLDVWGHTSGGPDPSWVVTREALRAGIAGISHGAGIPPVCLAGRDAPPPGPSGDRAYLRWSRSLWNQTDDAKLAALGAEMIERGVWLEPILVAEAWLARPDRYRPSRVYDAEYDFVGDSFRDLLRGLWTSGSSSELDRAFRRFLAFVARFHAAGGVVLTGTDVEILAGVALHEELRWLVTAGLSPRDALAAATRDAAIALGRGSELGTLAPGKLADLVILTDDPLADVRNTRSVWRVVKGGRVYDPALLRARLAASLDPGRTVAWTLGGSVAAALLVLLALRALARWRRTAPR